METPSLRQKPGPRPKGYARQHIFIPPRLADWAKEQDGGLSGLVRRLLDEEYAKKHGRPPRKPPPAALS